MKLTKLMLSAFVAAFALVSCNKQDTTPEISGRLKSVELSLANVEFTKAVTDKFLTANDQVVLKNFKIFLTDGTNLVTTLADAPEAQQFYYSASAETPLPGNAIIHYVPAAVSKVVIVGNVEETWGSTFTTYAQLKAAVLDINAQQSYDNLTLYGESGLTPAGEVHSHSNNTTYNLYEANVSVTPLIARFEVDGFAMRFSKDNPKYDKVVVKQIALNNYYTSTTINPLAPSAPVDRVGTVNDVNAFKFFADNLKATENNWYYDALAADEVVLTRPATADGQGEFIATDDMASKKAYHFFPGTEAPVIFIDLDVYSTGSDAATPSYLFSKEFKTSAGEPVTFAPGYVYRMNFQGDVTGDGDLPFEEDDINELDRCLDITVEVVKWAVVTIFPEF